MFRVRASKTGASPSIRSEMARMERCLHSLARKRLAEKGRESAEADRRIAEAEEAEIAIDTGRATVTLPDSKGSAD